MSSFQGRVAVVTGAGSGIGRALALGLASRGAKLALSDVQSEGLEETARLVAANGAEVDHRLLDVSDRDAWLPYAAAVKERFGVVNQLYNNAGIAYQKTILESELSDYDRVFGVNLWGVISGTKAFLPALIESGEGHVTNISSLNGIMAQANMSHYVSTKFAVRGFTETLRIEMLAGRHPVNVTVVHPGGIKTNIANAASDAARERGEVITEKELAVQKAYNEKLLKKSPESAAEDILKAVAKNRPRVVVGNDAKALDVVIRAAPGPAPAFIARSIARMMR